MCLIRNGAFTKNLPDALLEDLQVNLSTPSRPGQPLAARKVNCSGMAVAMFHLDPVWIGVVVCCCPNFCFFFTGKWGAQSQVVQSAERIGALVASLPKETV